MQTEMGKEGDSLEARFDINPKLSLREETAIRKVLLRWKDVFAENPKSPREIGTAEHVITLLDERPIRSRPLRVSPEIEAEVSKQIDEMLENGIIRPSSSSWASRVILVKKKDGTHRFAVDFRDLNDVTKRDAYPMPVTRDVFDRMGGATVFSTLDGASAYWSVPVKEKHREFTAFDGKDMLRCILMTSSNCLLNKKANNITSTTSCPKDTQRKILKLTSN